MAFRNRLTTLDASAITGMLTDDQLANPVAFGVGRDTVTNFATTATTAIYASVAVPIPVGFTRALVHVTCEAAAFNQAAGGGNDELYIRAGIIIPGGAVTDGAEMIALGLFNSYVASSASLAASYAGLTAGSIQVVAKIHTGVPWAMNTFNTANVNTSITFLR